MRGKGEEIARVVGRGKIVDTEEFIGPSPDAAIGDHAILSILALDPRKGTTLPLSFP
jgi:hypothetical protein